MSKSTIFAPILVLSAAGCAADAVTSDETEDSTEEALQTTCELGASCPSPLRVLRAKSFPGRPPTRFRTDVAIATTKPGFDSTPRIVRQSTSRPLTVHEDLSVTLSGDAAGSAPIEIDDFLLIEVLADDTGARLDAAMSGFADAEVTLDGKPLRRLGDNSLSLAAGSVDVAPLLPKDRAVRLRVSALDYGIQGHTSDVYLATVRRPGTTYTLAGTSSGGSFVVDDRVIVKVNGVEVASSIAATDGTASVAPMTFQARRGDEITVAIDDVRGGCRYHGDLWLIGPDAPSAPLAQATSALCGTAPNPEPYDVLRYRIGEPLAVGRYTLAGDASGRAFYVDDDVVVKVNGVEVAKDWDGSGHVAPMSFEARRGDVVTVAIHDTLGVARGHEAVWLFGPDGPNAPILGPVHQIWGTTAGTEPYDSVTYRIGDPPPASADPFSPASCVGPAMTAAEAGARFAPGTTETSPIGTFEIAVRQRTCSTLTGCTGWTVTPALWNIALGTPSAGRESAATSGVVKLHATGGAYRMTFVSGPSGSGDDLRIGHYVGTSRAQLWMNEANRVYWLFLGDTSWKSYGDGFDAVVTNRCARVAWSGRKSTHDASVHHDLEAVLLARFTR